MIERTNRAAFGKIVSSLVGDINMPVVGILTGGADFSSFGATIGTDPKGVPVLFA